VPAAAESVFVQSLAGRDGDDQQRNALIANSCAIARLLDDLRRAPVNVATTSACDDEWWPDTVTLTVLSVGAERTYAARFGTCNQVLGGTGHAAHATRDLRDDILRLVPNAGIS